MVDSLVLTRPSTILAAAYSILESQIYTGQPLKFVTFLPNQQ